MRTTTFCSVCNNNSISSLVMMMRMILITIVIVTTITTTTTTIVVVNGECMPPDTKDCGPFGKCVLVEGGDPSQDYCRCEPGYAGDDCSFEVELCADAVGSLSVASCYNNGHCYMTEEIIGDANLQVWKCDCRESFGQAHVYAGHQCEFPGEVSCERGYDISQYAFCVNGGRCVSQIRSGDKFNGCKCPANYEGRHCQYLKGSAPAQELEYLPPPLADPYKRMSGGVLFFLILCATLFVGGISFFGWYHTRTRNNNTNTNTNTSTSNDNDNKEEVGEELEMRNAQQQQPQHQQGVVVGESGNGGDLHNNNNDNNDNNDDFTDIQISTDQRRKEIV